MNARLVQRIASLAHQLYVRFVIPITIFSTLLATIPVQMDTGFKTIPYAHHVIQLAPYVRSHQPTVPLAFNQVPTRHTSTDQVVYQYVPMQPSQHTLPISAMTAIRNAQSVQDQTTTNVVHAQLQE